MVEVDPTSAVVGAAGEVPLIDTFQEPVAAVLRWGPYAGRLENKFVSTTSKVAVIGLAQLSSASAAVVGQSVSAPQTST